MAVIGISETESRWFAVHTKFRHEKRAVEMLERDGVHTCLPLKTVVKRYTSRTRTTVQPLISSFVFVCIKKNQYGTVLNAAYTHGFVKFGNQIMSIPEEELEFLKRLCQEDVIVEILMQDPFVEGAKVEITKGAFAGKEGKLVEIKGKKQFLIAIQGLENVLASIDIPREFLRIL